MPFGQARAYMMSSESGISGAAPIMASIQKNTSDTEQQQTNRDYINQNISINIAVEKVSNNLKNNNSVLIESEQQLISVNETLEKILNLRQSEDNKSFDFNSLMSPTKKKFKHKSRVRGQSSEKKIRPSSSRLRNVKEKVGGTLSKVFEKSKNIASNIFSPKEIMKGAAQTAIAGGALHYLTGKNDTMSAAVMGLSSTATGVLGMTTAIKGAFELSEKMNIGPSINRPSTTALENNNLKIKVLKDLPTTPVLKSGTILLADELRQLYPNNDSVGYSNQEWYGETGILGMLINGGYIKITNENVTSIQRNPMVNPISFIQPSLQNTNSNENNQYDSVVFDADTIMIDTNNFVGDFGDSQQQALGNQPGVQRISSPGSMTMTPQVPSAPGGEATYKASSAIVSDITPGAEVDTYDFNQPEQTSAEPLAQQRTNSQIGSVQEVVDFFKQKGYTTEQAVGIAANIKEESQFNPAAVGPGGRPYGLAQWLPTRQELFKKAFGKDIKGSSFKEQLEFINWELSGPESRARQALMAASTPEEAARIFDRVYERSSGASTNTRMAYAKEMMRSLAPNIMEAQQSAGQTLNDRSIAARPQRSPVNVSIPPRRQNNDRLQQASLRSIDQNNEIPLSQLVSTLV
jgi:hypothetical protein